MPSINRAVVPELPQLRRELGVRSRELEILTPDSEILEIVAPSWRNTRALLFTSAPVSSPDSSLVPRASAASMSTRWEMLLSPGGRTTPPTRRTLLVANPPAPARRPGEPRRECGGIAHLERALHGAQRFLQGAQRRQDLVAIHEQDFRPQRRVAGREARRVGSARAERRSGGRVAGEEIAEQRRHDLRDVTRRSELRVVLRRLEYDGFRSQHVVPEVRDFPGRIAALAARRHVHDRAAKQVAAGRLEAVPMGTRQRMTAGESPRQAEPLGTRDDAALHRSDVGDERA